MKFYFGQLLFFVVAGILLLAPWFVSKNNLTSHYIFYTLVIVVLGYNVIEAKQKALPVLLLIVGIGFALIFVNKAKTVIHQHERNMQEFQKLLNK